MSALEKSPFDEPNAKHWCETIDFELVGTDCAPKWYLSWERQTAKLTFKILQNQAKDCEFCQQLADLILNRLRVNTNIHTDNDDLMILDDAENVSFTVAIKDNVAVPNWSFGFGGSSLRKIVTIWVAAPSKVFGTKHFDIVLQRAGSGGRVPVSVDYVDELKNGDVEFLPPGSWRVDELPDESDENTPKEDLSSVGISKKVVGALNPTFGRPRPLLIEFDILRKWMSICDEYHSICQYDQEPISIPQFRLIDIKKKCVVQVDGSKRPPFATLSYVWGRKPFLRLVKANIDELEEEGCLERLELPPTIQDAITICEELWIDHLWIDSLCIIQDDESVMLEVVDKMDSIYREGILTIIAASGADAYSGIPGVRPNTRFLEQRALNVRGVQLLDSVDEHQFRVYYEGRDPEWISSAPWSRRAWTFQEALVSRRSLFFTSEQVYWSCREGLMSEDTTEHLDLEAFAKPHEDRYDSDYSPGEYESIAVTFSTRSLTYEADIGRAFQATQNYLEKKWPGFKISWGLPHYTFGPCLMWERPFKEDRRLREGTHAVRQHDGTIVKVSFPSWSWMAWTEGSRLMVFYGDEPSPHSPWYFVFDSASELVAIPYGEGYEVVSPLAELLSNGTGFRREAVTEDVLPPELHISPSLRHIALSFYTEVATVRYNPADVINYPPRDLQMKSYEYPFSIKVGQKFYRILEEDQDKDGLVEIDLVAVFSGKMTKPPKFRGEYRLYCWPVVKKGGLRQRASDSSTVIFLRLWRELPGIRWELVTLI
ncbi:uncharacterized protein FIESC28_09130 [Fusarium coffeatum]|uniref:Heterokaryon incompatibility domain-containing protein n=1 Tax=Fusarium coffeatum TaxID=231269 RepID=A0A366R4H9_9HYPO|nr:uncharacterized protein FIESC28_09130 [Fusarium coffeatum]RBR11246.1 hypothetical protein FIESC28_09130 [Fusarium coffeatum]